MSQYKTTLRRMATADDTGTLVMVVDHTEDATTRSVLRSPSSPGPVSVESPDTLSNLPKLDPGSYSPMSPKAMP